MTATVAVVVPTRNSIRTVRACLDSVRAQQDVAVELVVVDNHSDDGTLQAVREVADRVLVGGPERSAQRNLGVRSSAAPWICWVDSDMVLPPATLAAALAAAERCGVRAVAIAETSVGPGYWTRCRALERRCYLDHDALHNPRLLRRDLFEQLDGFGESMAGPEDADLRLRLRAAGEPVALVAAPAIVHDEGRLTLRGVWSKRVYYGRSLPQLAAAHRRAVAGQARDLAGAYWRHRRLLLADPVHLPGLVFLRVLEAAGYLVGARRGRTGRGRRV